MNGSSPDPTPSVWLCDSADWPTGNLPPWLTASEQHRLQTLTGRSHNEFLASRWLIRQALSSASGEPPGQCRPTDGRARQSGQPPGWWLSVSHSQGLAGCAISPNSPIGLDLEPLSRQLPWRRIASRWFAPAEQAWLFDSGDTTAFLKAWTLKEAWLKATGRGIAGNLQTLTITRDFELAGDQPEQPWRAALGQCDNFLVALVYCGNHRPTGRKLAGQPGLKGQAFPRTEYTPVHWFLHRTIGPFTQQRLCSQTNPEDTQ